MKRFFSFFFIMIVSLNLLAQSEEQKLNLANNISADPFLFSISTLTPENSKWNLDYSGSYGERVVSPFGFDGVSQQIAVNGYLGKRFTLYANAAVGFPKEDEISSAFQAEIIRDLFGGKKNLGLRVGAGLGVRNDFTNVNSMLGRATISYVALKWKAGGNLLFEKAFASDRDAIDIITSIGFHYRFINSLYGGVEAIGEDLEGLWDKEEAEGGAKVMVGPSLNLAPKNSRFSFSLSGGPVIYATQNQVTNPDAVRELPSQSGLLVRAKVIFKLI